MSKQPLTAPTARVIGPCPSIIQFSRTPRNWKFTQRHRTTRPAQCKLVNMTNVSKTLKRPIQYDKEAVKLVVICMEVGF